MRVGMCLEPGKTASPFDLLPPHAHEPNASSELLRRHPSSLGTPARVYPRAMQEAPLSPGWITVLRGLRHRCPACGRGRLYQSYLKQVPACAICGAPLGRIRA
ncbi:hypothetical protein RZS08_46135, partial [Arthrospira platensis SPKY1]|nr:hypothetical protein [Arthrospira platensis SPKY1]